MMRLSDTIMRRLRSRQNQGDTIPARSLFGASQRLCAASESIAVNQGTMGDARAARINGAVEPGIGSELYS